MEPVAPRAFCHTISPRRRRARSSWSTRTTSPARERYGLRPRFATFTAMRPPGSSTRRHSANTSRSIARYSRYEPGTPPSPRAASYSLPAKYGGDVTTSATQPSGRSRARASAQRSGSPSSTAPATRSSPVTSGARNRA